MADFNPVESGAGERLLEYNDGVQTAANPRGFDGDGHLSNFIPSLRDVVMFGRGVVRVATETLAAINGTAARFEAAVVAIQAGPVTSVNGQSGAVVVDLPRVLPPGNTSPASGATAALSAGALSLAVVAFSSLYGGAQKSRQAQISTTANFASLVWDSGVVAGSNLFVTLANAQATLTGGTTYYWRFRQTDAQDYTSDWSAPTSFVFPRAPSAPTVTVPANGATGQGANNAAIAFAASDYAHPNNVARARRVFQISTTSTFAAIVTSVVSASGSSTASLATPKDVLQPDTLYYVRCQDTDANGGTNTSASTTFRTVTAFRPNIGDPYQGGFYAGQINDGGAIYDLIVSPKSGGEIRRGWASTSSSGNYNTTDPARQSRTNGPRNTVASASAGANAAQFCDQLVLNGYSDWYLPAVDEIEIAYRNLKPTTEQNTAGYGANANSVPAGTDYTATNPAQTTVAAFKDGGAEAFAATDWYWSSTEVTATTADTKIFSAGQDRKGQGLTKTSSYYARAFRRVAA